MKAIVIHAAKDLRIEESAVGASGPGEVEIHFASSGISGSDLYYDNHGGFGTVRLKEPMILGHDVSGHIAVLGDGVSDVAIGDLVAVSSPRRLRLLPEGNGEPLLQHALLRLGHVLCAHPGRVPRTAS